MTNKEKCSKVLTSAENWHKLIVFSLNLCLILLQISDELLKTVDKSHVENM